MASWIGQHLVTHAMTDPKVSKPTEAQLRGEKPTLSTMPTEIAQQSFSYALDGSPGVRHPFNSIGAERFRPACTLILVDPSTALDIVHVLKVVRESLVEELEQAEQVEAEAKLACMQLLSLGRRRLSPLLDDIKMCQGFLVQLQRARDQKAELEKDSERLARLHEKLAERIKGGQYQGRH